MKKDNIELFPVKNFEKYFIMKKLTENYYDIEKYLDKIGNINIEKIKSKYEKLIQLGDYIAKNFDEIYNDDILSIQFYKTALIINKDSTKEDFLINLMDHVHKQILHIELEFLIKE